MLDTLTGLPAALSTAAVAAAVSTVLAVIAPLVASVPGFRDADTTRNALMRTLVFLLTLGGLVGLAWTQRIVLTQAQIPALLVYAAGGTLGTHVLYTNIRNSGATYVPVAQPPAPAPVTQGSRIAPAPVAPAPSVPPAPANATAL